MQPFTGYLQLAVAPPMMPLDVTNMNRVESTTHIKHDTIISSDNIFLWTSTLVAVLTEGNVVQSSCWSYYNLIYFGALPSGKIALFPKDNHLIDVSTVVSCSALLTRIVAVTSI